MKSERTTSRPLDIGHVDRNDEEEDEDVGDFRQREGAQGKGKGKGKAGGQPQGKVKSKTGKEGGREKGAGAVPRARTCGLLRRGAGRAAESGTRWRDAGGRGE